MSKEYFRDLRYVKKDVAAIFGGLLAGFSILGFVGYRPVSPPLTFLVHEWRDSSVVVWGAFASFLGFKVPEYFASGLTLAIILIGLSLRCMWLGQSYYGRILWSAWPWSVAFENHTWWTGAAFWVISLYGIGVVSLTFGVPFGDSEQIPRDLPHDGIRAVVGCVATGAACFPSVVGSTVLSLLVLVAIDALIPVLVHLFRTASAG